MKKVTPQQVRERIAHYAALPYPTEISPGRRGRVIGALNKALKFGDTDPKEHRYRVLGWFFGEGGIPIRSGGLTPQQVHSLERWIWIYEGEGRYTKRAEFERECRLVLMRARIDYPGPVPIDEEIPVVADFANGAEPLPIDWQMAHEQAEKTRQ